MLIFKQMQLMKKQILYIIGALLGLGMASSCTDKLDADKYFKDRMTLNDVFTEKNRTLRWLSHAYSYLSTQDNIEVSTEAGTIFNFSDDIYFYGNKDLYTQFKRGTYNENSRQDSWNNCYNGIRQAAIFIYNVDKNYNLTSEERVDYKAQARFVRAYYYWLLLRKYGPVVIAPDEGFDYTQSYDELSVPRSTYDECADYIAEEMRTAAADLPLSRGADEMAMPTRGAALAVRAKVLLYAASPINNPHADDKEKFTDMKNSDGKFLLAQEYNNGKWAKAAAAALDVMRLGSYELNVSYYRSEENATDGYPATVSCYEDGDFSLKDWPDGYKDIDPFESYRSLFNGEISGEANKEIIFSRHQNVSGGFSIAVFARRSLPLNPANGENTIGITQKQCDAYYMYDGTDCPGKERELGIQGRSDMRPREAGFVSPGVPDTHIPGFEGLNKNKYEGVSRQYANREPRFYASVAFSGYVWPLLANLEVTTTAQYTMQQVFYYRGDPNGYSANSSYPPTGIGFNKFVNPYDSAPDKNNNRIYPKTEPALRYADILLAYAEAINELEGQYEVPSWDNSETYTITRSIDEMKRGVRPVRCRGGVPDYEMSVYRDPVQFRTKLKRERQIEFVGEGQRYFDLRRWKDAEIEESMDVYGCNILMAKAQRALFYVPTISKELTSVFTRKKYFWPIPMNELKRNKNLVQNPGWMYHD